VRGEDGCVSAESHPQIEEDKPNTLQNVCDGRFMIGGQMDKAPQHKNV
jgi:hypothetical protein